MKESQNRQGINNANIFIPFSDDVIDILGGRNESAVYKITINEPISEEMISNQYQSNLNCNKNYSLDGPWEEYDQEIKDVLIEYRSKENNYELIQNQSDLFIFFQKNMIDAF